MLERLIASDTLPTHRLVVLRNGEVVPASHFRGEDGRLQPGSIETLVTEGVSFVLNGIDDDVPAIAQLSDALERSLGHDVWVNAYVTHGPGGALPPHYDDHDVVVVQVHGKKRWFGHGTPFPSPVERSPDGEDFGPHEWSLLVEPGDVLFVPRGEVHHTEVEGADSVHLTFGIDTRRGVDLLSTLAREAALDVAFREDLTRLGGSSHLAARERDLKDRLHALIEGADLAAYLADDDARRALRALPHLGARPVTETCELVLAVRRASFAPGASTETRTVRTGGASFVVSSGAAEVLRFLLERNGATFAEVVLASSKERDPRSELPSDQASLHQSIEELVRHGLVAPKEPLPSP